MTRRARRERRGRGHRTAGPQAPGAARALRPARSWLLGLALCAPSCEAVAPLPPQPRVLAVDLLDNQALVDGRPAQRRLYDGAAVTSVPESGPDLSLRLALSLPLSMQSLSDAPRYGLLLRDSEGAPITLRSFAALSPDAAGADAPAGTAQLLSLLPDLRSARSYLLSLDRSYLLTEGAVRFDTPPPLPFRTAPRFVVVRADPPDGASTGTIDRLRLSFSSPVNARVSGQYGVVLTRAGGDALPATFELSQNGRQLTVLPLCPLPLGPTRVSVPVGAVEEDSTLASLAEPFAETVTVTEDPGPCAEAPDLAGPPHD